MKIKYITNNQTLINLLADKNIQTIELRTPEQIPVLDDDIKYIIACEDEYNQGSHWIYDLLIQEAIEKKIFYIDLNPSLIIDLIKTKGIYAINDLIAKEQEKQIKETYIKKKRSYNNLNKFINRCEKKSTEKAIETGYKQLDIVLDGLYPGLYTIGATPSLGKTTLMLNIMDNIAFSGHDVLIFSLEMSFDELTSKSVSKESFIINDLEDNEKSLKNRTILSKMNDMSENQLDQLLESVQAYGEPSKNIFLEAGEETVIGVKEIKQTIATHIFARDKKPVVLVDYLQLLAPYSDKMTDKQNIDRSIKELKIISRDYKIPVLLISSLNRESYRNGKQLPISISSFKESGIIEYSSDVVIGLQYKRATEEDFDPLVESDKYPREIQLKILKNRNGRSGKTIDYLFYTKYNYFAEVPKAPKEYKTSNKTTGIKL